MSSAAILSPRNAEVSPEAAALEETALAALRGQIDRIDADMVALFQRRLELARQVGRAKDAPQGPYVKLRPDREQAVLARVTGLADDASVEPVAALWREIVGWGLAQQGRIGVRVWAPVDPTRAWDGARLRFGRAADIRLERDPQAALAYAAEGRGVAVLAVNAGDPWWMGLTREWAGLTVFDGYGGEIPSSLAVGRIDPASLPTGRRVVVNAGGDAGDGAGMRRQGLDTHHGWTLALTDAPLEVGGPEGCVGAI